MRARSTASIPPAVSVFDRWLFRLVVFAVIVTPLFFVSAKDSYRFPKEMLFRAQAILLVLILVIEFLVRGPRAFAKFRRWKTDLILSAAVVSWVGITVLFSTNRNLSREALIWVLAALIFALSVLAIGRQAHLSIIVAVLIPAGVNAVLAILQELRIWNPFQFDPQISGHGRTTALLGNPNDVGTYLVFPALAAVTLAVVDGKKRKRYVIVALVLLAGLVATRTLTALLAYGIGVVVLAMMVIRRERFSGRRLAAAAAILGVLIVVALLPLYSRIVRVVGDIAAGQFDAALSARLLPYAVAVEMARDRPLLGLGPGTFRWHFFPYKIQVEQKYPKLAYSTMRAVNFGEAHNDHLQILAEAGVPGYILLLCISVLVARGSLRLHPHRASGSNSPEALFAKLFGVTLISSFLVLALAQFPLHLAAPLQTLLFFAALCRAWS